MVSALGALLVVVPAVVFAQPAFKKQFVAAESSETVGVFDVNKDGQPDIVSGGFWYAGPAFTKRTWIGGVQRTGPNGEYWSEFGNIPLDVNGDGYIDYVSGDWFSASLWWRENPGKAGGRHWKKHFIDSVGNVEVVLAWDMNGDGVPEIVPNTPGHPLRVFTLKRDAAGHPGGSFVEQLIYPKQGHGLGYGDIDGDGHKDFVLPTGWLQCPADPSGTWVFHVGPDLGDASAPVLVADVNGDQKKDIIAGKGHAYGLSWYEQTKKPSGDLGWIRHPIDTQNAQFHSLVYTDIDGDGRKEIITGKRYRAHNGNDPGSADPPGLYYFKWDGHRFNKYTIAYGQPGEGKGTGLSFVVKDIDGNHKKDIVVAGKDGLFIFYGF